MKRRKSLGICNPLKKRAPLQMAMWRAPMEMARLVHCSSQKPIGLKPARIEAAENREQRWRRIEGRMWQLEPMLRRQGVIVPKAGRRSPVWVLGYNDHSSGAGVQKCVYLGIDAVVVERALDLLAQFRWPAW